MLHFLSVEDDPTHYQLLWAALLQVKLGVEFDQALQHAPDAHSALVHLGALPEEALPDVIFTDVQMPGMNGWDLVQRLQESPRYRRIPIIVVTDDEPDDPVRGAKALAKQHGVGYVSKLVTNFVAELEAELRRVLGLLP